MPPPSHTSGALAQNAGQRVAAPQRPAVRAAIPPADLGLILLTVLIWASLHPIAKRTLDEITPVQLPFSRVALGSLFLIVVCLCTGRIGRFVALFHPRQLWKVAILGATGFTFSSGLAMVALSYMPAGLNSVLANASPLMVAVGVMLFLRQRLHWRMLLGLVVGFVGVVVIALRGGVDATSLNVVGVTLALTSSATWATYTVLARRLSAGQDVIAMSAATSFVGALPLGLVVLLEGEASRLVTASLSTQALLLWCGVIATGASFTVWVLMLRRIEAARVASFQYGIPLGALVLAYFIAGEVPTPVALVGAGMIIGGVAIANSVNAPARARRA